MHLFSNLLGVFVFDKNFKIADKIEFGSLDEYENRTAAIEKLKSMHPGCKEPGELETREILKYFKSREFFERFYSKNLNLSKHLVKNSVSEDLLLIQAIKSIGDIERCANLLVKRLREWYELYNPEFSREVFDHRNFAKGILSGDKKELLSKLGLNADDSIGADISGNDLIALKRIAQQLNDLYELKDAHERYISGIMDRLCPNLKALCGALLGASLIERAGSLKRLSEFAASTVQILGAENALFRHMTTGARPPRHGIIVNHPLISRAPNKLHGKIARKLADKISIAVKVDYFKGEFIGDALLKDLEAKLKWTN